jgi:hypothetical protein
MTLLRIFLAAFLVAISGYTAVTVSQHGFNLIPVFFGDMAKMGWAGQFNFDFMGFLALSGIWVAWRHGFRPAGLMLGLVAFFGGMMFLSLYLLVESYRTRGNIAALLLGPERV